MTNATVNAAICNHKAWAGRFRAMVASRSAADAGAWVRDARHCALGRFIDSDAVSFDNAHSLDLIRALHDTFHEIAGVILDQIAAGESLAEVAGMLAELDALSEQLATLLQVAQVRLPSVSPQ